MSSDQPLGKEQILEAAEQVLRRYGPDKTSVMDVARALQVSHGTLYRHFPSKASLREAVTERWLSHGISAPLAEIAGGTEGSYVARLRLWLETLIGSKRTYAVSDPEMFAMYAAVTAEAAEVIDEHVNRLIGQMARIVEGGVRAGELRNVPPAETARAIFLATSRFHHPAHSDEWTSERTDRDFEAVWKLLLNSISASPADRP